MRALHVKFLILAAVLLLGAALAYAAAPDVMKFETKTGIITLNHKAHSGYKDVTCKTCHHEMKNDKVEKKCRDCHCAKAEGKKLTLKKAMHKNCKDCHKKIKKGPTKCLKCHIKAKK